MERLTKRNGKCVDIICFKNKEPSGYAEIIDVLANCLAAYEDAEEQGRLVVLSEPMVPLMVSDDEMDTDVYCPKCGESLSGGWQDSEADDTRKLCQCPRCGQSIDDTKVISRADAKKAMEVGK